MLSVNLLLVTAFALGWFASANGVQAQTFAPNDAVVTGFSGTKTSDALKPGTNPLDSLFIDLDGASAQIFRLGAPGAPTEALLKPAVPLKIKARDVGQVLGIALDGNGATTPVPNIYLGATSAFGLQLVTRDTGGKLQRAKTGSAAAEWMPGQFGPGGGPGSIYKVNGDTGAVTLFATIPGSSGPGIGALAYDPATKQLFASDLGTGLVHRIGADGTVIDDFDHGITGRAASAQPLLMDDGAKADIKSAAFNSEKPETWGLTQPERRIWALAVHGGRVYYAVWAGPQVWSVGLNADGSFANDPKKEFDVKASPQPNPIASMTFASDGALYLAQRGGIKGSYDYSVFADSGTSNVLRYKQSSPGVWSDKPADFPVGLSPDHKFASGGVALGMGLTNAGTATGQCNMLWATGDALRSQPNVVHGLEGIDISADGVLYLVDYDGLFNDPSSQGHVGDVEVWRSCPQPHAAPPVVGAGPGATTPAPGVPPGAPGATPSAPDTTPAVTPVTPSGGGGVTPGSEQPSLSVTKTGGDCTPDGNAGDFNCTYHITVTNTGAADFPGPISLDETVANPFGTPLFSPPWICAPDAADQQLSHCTLPAPLPAGQSVTLDVTSRVAHGNLSQTPCRIPNTVTLSGGAGGNASATDTINSPDCQQTSNPLPPPPPPPPGPTESFDLHVKKDQPICTVNPPGSFPAVECSWTVHISNNGKGPFVSSDSGFAFEETLSGGPDPLTFSADKVPLGWDCGPSGPRGLDCTVTPGNTSPPLGPGETMDFVLSAGYPATVGQQITNCMEAKFTKGSDPLDATPGDNKSCVSSTLPLAFKLPQIHVLTSDLELRKDFVNATCDKNGYQLRCRFHVSVVNNGPDTFKGNVTIDEELPAGTYIDDPKACHSTGTTPDGKDHFECVIANPSALGTLDKGGGVDFDYTVVVPANAIDDTCHVKNTAQIAHPPGGSSANIDPSNDTKSASTYYGLIRLPDNRVTCDPPGLTIKKTASTDACKLVGDHYDCDFLIVITSVGTPGHPDTYHGPLDVTETVPPGASLKVGEESALVGWSCTGGGSSYHCHHDNVDMPVGQVGTNTAGLHVIVSVPAASATGGNSCNVPNTAKFSMTTGTQSTNRMSSSATARILGGPSCYAWTGSSSCSPGYVWNGTTCVSLTGPSESTGPQHFAKSDLVLNKYGDSSCVQRGANWECNFVVWVQNYGQPQGYQGDIDFDETLGVTPITTTFVVDPSPFVAWSTCQGSGIAYHCHIVGKNGQKLAQGEMVTLHVTVLVPDDGSCSPVPNLAALTPSTGEAAGFTAFKNTGVCAPGNRAQSNTPTEGGQHWLPLDWRSCPDSEFRLGGPEGPCCSWIMGKLNKRCRCVSPTRSRPDSRFCCPRGQQWNGHDCVTPCDDLRRRKSDLTCCPLNTHAAGDSCPPDIPHELYCPPERMMPGGKCCPEHTTWNGEQCFLPMTPKGEKSDVEVPPTVCEAGYIAFPSRGRVPKGWDIRTMAGDDTRVCAKGAITSGQSSSSAAEQPGGAKPRVPNLVLTKTSDGSCSPTDGTQAWVCNYTLTLTNTGEAAYSGNIEFDEQFGAPPIQVQGFAYLLINGAFDDLQCKGSGASVHCGAAIGSLRPGESIQELITEAVADDGACTPIANTATLSLPAAPVVATVGRATALATRDTSTCVPGRSVRANPVVTTLSGCDVGYIPLPLTRYLPKGFPTKPSLHADTVCAKASIASDSAGQSNSKAQLPPNPCDAGYTEFPSVDRVPKGWETKPSLNIAATSVCARAVPSGDTSGQSSSPTQLTCDPGWTAFPTLASVPASWETQTAPRADASIVCARAATQSSTPAACPAGFVLREERCVSTESKGEDSGSSSSRVKQPDVCPIGTVGTPPDCKRMTIEKIPKNDSGSSAEKVKEKTPRKEEKVKEPPKCPLGTVGTPPNCKRIVIEKIPKKGGDATKQRKCPPGTFGPNCTKLIFKKKSAPSPGQVPR